MFRSGLQWQRRSDERVVQSLRFGQVGHSPKECVESEGQTASWIPRVFILLTFWLWTWTSLILIFHSFQSKFQPSTVCTYDRSRYLTIDEFGRMLFKLDGDAHGNLGWKLFSVFVPSLLFNIEVFKPFHNSFRKKNPQLFLIFFVHIYHIKHNNIIFLRTPTPTFFQNKRKGLEYNCQNERSFGVESWWIWNAESYGQSVSHHGPCDLKARDGFLGKQMVVQVVHHAGLVQSVFRENEDKWSVSFGSWKKIGQFDQLCSFDRRFMLHVLRFSITFYQILAHSVRSYHYLWHLNLMYISPFPSSSHS